MMSSAANHYVTLRLGEEIATVPGYNIHVGFNKEPQEHGIQEIQHYYIIIVVNQDGVLRTFKSKCLKKRKRESKTMI